MDKDSDLPLHDEADGDETILGKEREGATGPASEIDTAARSSSAGAPDSNDRDCRLPSVDFGPIAIIVPTHREAVSPVFSALQFHRSSAFFSS